MGSFVNFLALYSSIHRPSSVRALVRSKNGVIARISHLSNTHTHTHTKQRRDSTGIDISFSFFFKSLPCTRSPTVTHQRVLSRACTHADKQRSPPEKTHPRPRRKPRGAAPAGRAAGGRAGAAALSADSASSSSDASPHPSFC